MNIQTITKMLTDAGIEPNEAKIEVKMLLEHFCKYTEKDRLMGREPENIEIIKKKCRKELKPEYLFNILLAKLILWESFSRLHLMFLYLVMRQKFL